MQYFNYCHYCLSRNLITTVHAILDQGVDVDIANNDGLTPLHIAAQEGNSKMMSILLSRGAQCNMKVWFKTFQQILLKIT